MSSGLLFRTFRQMQSVDLGFTERRALTFELGLPRTRYETHAAAEAFVDELLERLAALPGVASVGAVAPQCLPLDSDMCWGEPLSVEGRPTAEGEVPPVVGVRLVAGDYFATLGIPVRGRLADGGGREVVVSEATALACFGVEDPIGRRVGFSGTDQWYTVVGVAENVRAQITTEDFQRLFHLATTDDPQPGPTPHGMTYVVKTTLPPEALTPAVRRAVAELDQGVPLAKVRSLETLVAQPRLPPSSRSPWWAAPR
ncbi:MAG TPA: ABC transporter permease [Longimicrobiales bacterium]|nr:ABC transporter permease [Longimicrobiales bacterium]